MPLWLLTAWTWFKKNWHWVVFPIGILMLVAGWERKTTVVVNSPVLEGADKKKAELDAAAQKAELEAAQQRDKTIQQADATEQKATDAVVIDQQQKLPGLEADPDALNAVLHDVGQQQRKPPS
jgi:hypothetical protein